MRQPWQPSLADPVINPHLSYYKTRTQWGTALPPFPPLLARIPGTNKEWRRFWASHTRSPPRVWQAFHKCPLPAAHKDFIHRALWKRLGDKKIDWKPAKANCPLDGQQETISHSLFHCTLLTSAFNKIESSFVPAVGTSPSVKYLMQHCPAEALSTLPVFLGGQPPWPTGRCAAPASETPPFEDLWLCFLKNGKTSYPSGSDAPHHLPIARNDLSSCKRPLTSPPSDPLTLNPAPPTHIPTVAREGARRSAGTETPPAR